MRKTERERLVEVRATGDVGRVVRVFDGGQVELEFLRDGLPTRGTYGAESLELVETLVYFIDGKRQTDVASEQLSRRSVPHSVKRWQGRVYRVEVPESYEAKVAEVLR